MTGTPEQTNLVSALLAAKALLTPESWVKETPSPFFNTYCAWSALYKVPGVSIFDLEQVFIDANGIPVPDEATIKRYENIGQDACILIFAWNDVPERTLEEVLKAFDKAIALVDGASCEDEGCPHFGDRHSHPAGNSGRGAMSGEIKQFETADEADACLEIDMTLATCDCDTLSIDSNFCSTHLSMHRARATIRADKARIKELEAEITRLHQIIKRAPCESPDFVHETIPNCPIILERKKDCGICETCLEKAKP